MGEPRKHFVSLNLESASKAHMYDAGPAGQFASRPGALTPGPTTAIVVATIPIVATTSPPCRGPG